MLLLDLLDLLLRGQPTWNSSVVRHNSFDRRSIRAVGLGDASGLLAASRGEASGSLSSFRGEIPIENHESSFSTKDVLHVGLGSVLSARVLFSARLVVSLPMAPRIGPPRRVPFVSAGRGRGLAPPSGNGLLSRASASLCRLPPLGPFSPSRACSCRHYEGDAAVLSQRVPHVLRSTRGGLLGSLFHMVLAPSGGVRASSEACEPCAVGGSRALVRVPHGSISSQ